MRILFLVIFMVSALAPFRAEAKNFQIWLDEARAEARARGISQHVVNAALPLGMQPLSRVLKLDRKQPESTVSYAQYLRNVVSQARIDQGRENIRANDTLLTRVSNAYGVEKEVIVALWGIETNYGSNMGGFEIIPALATLAYDGRRSAFFRDELFKALKIVDEGHISLHELRGSWAGAMGQTQFMPSSFFRFAQDFNNDGRRDIWDTKADVFASAANYLAKSGWQKGVPWGRKVALPANFDTGLLGIQQQRSLQFWHDKGVRMMDGSAVPFESEYEGSIIQPGGPGGQAYIVYGNYRVILSWNKSSYFATSVGLLSDLLKKR